MAQPIIYLDHAAATPMDPRVLATMQPFFSTRFFNPSATYLAAVEVRQALSRARTRIGHWLGARPSEIIFTAGGSEANNLAIHGIMRRFPKGNVVVSAMEHESVLEPAGAYDYREVKLESDGRINLEDLQSKIDENTVLVSIMYANNEIGTVQPIREVAKIIARIRQTRDRTSLPLYFHTDAAQAANYLDLHVSRLGVDLMTLNGGKIYGPKQSGVLHVRAGIRLLPLISGGGQEQGLRSGTENVPSIVGLATALDIVQSERHQETERLKILRRQFFALLEKHIPQAVINGSKQYRLPNNVHVTIAGHDNERLLIQLDQAGILAAAGSACSASRAEPSHVLKAIGLNDAEAQASLRFTMGHGTTKKMIDHTVVALSRLV